MDYVTDKQVRVGKRLLIVIHSDIYTIRQIQSKCSIGDGTVGNFLIKLSAHDETLILLAQGKYGKKLRFNK